MGRLESQMWKSYYDGHWLRLARQTMQVSCGEYGFSWWDGTRMSIHAALAAKYFRKDTHDPRCLEQLIPYYRIIQQGIGQQFSIEEAAHLELQWWQERRQNLAPKDYAETIARLTEHVYGIPVENALTAARLRTEAMAYRDARRNGMMTDRDWSYLEQQLTEAYATLHRAVQKSL
jgi:hypothetical protein